MTSPLYSFLRAAALVCLLSTAAIIGGCDGTASAEPEDLTTLRFTVDGMHCQGCVGSVRNAIAKIDGVSSCEVSLDEGSALVKATDPAVSGSIIEAVAALDFTIEPAD